MAELSKKEKRRAERQAAKEQKQKEKEKPEEEKIEGFSPINYNLFNVKKLTDKIQDKIKNGKISREDFTEVFDAIKKVDNLDPKELLKASNEIKEEVKQPTFKKEILKIYNL